MNKPPDIPRRVPITDLGREYDTIKSELTPVLDRILSSGSYVLGKELSAFEHELSAYLGARHAIGVNSGTDAIHLALRALNIAGGDEVIVPAMSFFATVEPIVLLGAKPVFVDIDPKTYAINPALIKQKITKQTKAIIAVHLYGLPADLQSLLEIAQEHNIPLIEDMAQAIGSTYRNKKIGSWGSIACLSFYPTKNLGACGDAGAVISSSDELAERVRNLRNHGAKIKYHHDEVAYNSRLDEIQAAVLRLKLKHLDEWNRRRQNLAKHYTKALAGLPLILPHESPDREHVYHLYTVQSERRDELKTFLEQKKISVGLHYPITLPLLPALSHLGHHVNDFPVSEKLARQTLSLPLYPFMSTDDVDFVSDQIKAFY